jgi:pimeloyl-ACP methyl ester carboxylesterase
MHYPAKVKRVAAMAANVAPDGAVPEIVTLVKDSLASMPAAAQETPAGRRELRLARVLLDEPHIPLAALETITAPTLILASDHDLIQDEHTLAIYHHIPNSELNIFPGATHMVPYDDPVLFNASVQRFFATPYVPKDRIKDVLKSLGSLKASQN